MARLHSRVVRCVPWLVVLTLLLVLGQLPSTGDANYYLSFRIGGHDYGSPARCVALTESRFECTPLQALPASADGAARLGLAAPLFAHSGAPLRCDVSPSARYSCTTYPVGSVEQAGLGL